MGVLSKVQSQGTGANSGMTLTEVLVVIAVFTILVALLYPTFSFLRMQTNLISDMEVLNSKGQRVLNYLAEDLKLAGMLLGPEARIPYCTNGAEPEHPNVIAHSAGAVYDTLTFITAAPVEVSPTASCIAGQRSCGGAERTDYVLTTVCDAKQGASSVAVDAGSSCYEDHLSAADGARNGRSLITFETLAPLEVGLSGAAPQVYYTVTGTQSALAISPPLASEIQDNSTVHAVRQYRYRVDRTGGRRDLIREGWGRNCSTAGSQSEIVETVGQNTEAGGVEALHFEFLFSDAASGNLVARRTLPLTAEDWTAWKLSQLKAVRIWLVLRADLADRDYVNREIYRMGDGRDIAAGPFNDHYRRLLLTRTVEVRNLAIKSP